MSRRLTSPIRNAALASMVGIALSHGALAAGADPGPVPAPPPDPAPCIAALGANDDDKIVAACGVLADNDKTLKADRIKTPTLFMSGDKDFNVPTAGSEQMYQALRTLGVPTELIVYPGQFHGISLPSYQRDRFDRWLAWFNKYLGPPAP